MDIWQLLDLTTPWCLLTAATLRIPELVAAGTQPSGRYVVECGFLD